MYLIMYVYGCVCVCMLQEVKMRGAVLGCLLLVCAVLLLTEQAEGHVTFFSPKEMREMVEVMSRTTPQ